MMVNDLQYCARLNLVKIYVVECLHFVKKYTIFHTVTCVILQEFKKIGIYEGCSKVCGMTMKEQRYKGHSMYENKYKSM